MAVYRYGKKTSDINVQPDFAVKDTKSDAFIKNRPDSTLSISLNGAELNNPYNPNTGSKTIDIDLENIQVLSATYNQTPSRDTRYYIDTENLTTTINKPDRVGLMITVIANVATTIKYPNNSGTMQTKVMEAGTVLPLFSCGNGYTPNLYGLVLDINPNSVSNGQIYIKTK